MNYGKTITTYLVDGLSSGIKTVELSNWIGKAIIMPRAKLKDLKQRQEVLQPAIYFLFGKDNNGNDLAYIGEAENLINRIGNHDTNKDFWDIMIGFISKDNNLTKADVKYLEAKAIEKAKKSNRYSLKNGVEPIPNNLPEYQISTMNEFLDNIDLLISSIGYPIIKEINTQSEEYKNEMLYYCKGPDADAKGYYLSDGFYIIKNSKIRIKLAPATGNWVKELQNKLLLEGIIVVDSLLKDSYVLQKDYLFKSPSAAAQIVLGRSANGWTEWKTKDGKTLDEIERKN